MTVGRANNKCDNLPCSLLPHRRRRISESIFITACSVHDEENRIEHNLFVRSGKSEADLRSTDRHESSCGLSVTDSRATCIISYRGIRFTNGYN